MNTRARRRSSFLRVEAGTASGRKNTAGKTSPKVLSMRIRSIACDGAGCAAPKLLVASCIVSVDPLSVALQLVFATVTPRSDTMLHFGFEIPVTLLPNVNT